MVSSPGDSRWLDWLILAGICAATVCLVAINFAVSPQNVMTASNAVAELGAPPVLGGCLSGFLALRAKRWWRAFLYGFIGTIPTAIFFAIVYGIIQDLIQPSSIPSVITAFNQLVIGPIAGVVFGIVYAIRVARRVAA